MEGDLSAEGSWTVLPRIADLGLRELLELPNMAGEEGGPGLHLSWEENPAIATHISVFI